MAKPKKPTLKDVREAEAAYLNAATKGGENNLVTVRAHGESSLTFTACTSHGVQ